MAIGCAPNNLSPFVFRVVNHDSKLWFQLSFAFRSLFPSLKKVKKIRVIEVHLILEALAFFPLRDKKNIYVVNFFVIYRWK